MTGKAAISDNQRAFRTYLLIAQCLYGGGIACVYLVLSPILLVPEFYRLPGEAGSADSVTIRVQFFLLGATGIIYFIASLFACFDRPWAWAITIARPIALVIYDAINYISHFYDILFGQYQHNSAVMFIGAVSAFVFYNFFHLVLIFLIFRNRDFLLGLFQEWRLRRQGGHGTAAGPPP